MGKSLIFKPKQKQLTLEDWMKREQALRDELYSKEKKWEEEQKMEAMQDATEISALLHMYVLHKEFGFGQERLLRLNDAMNNVSSAIADGLITWDDIYNECYRLGFMRKER